MTDSDVSAAVEEQRKAHAAMVEMQRKVDLIQRHAAGHASEDSQPLLSGAPAASDEAEYDQLQMEVALASKSVNRGLHGWAQRATVSLRRRKLGGMVVLLDLVESDQFSLASLGLVLVNVAVMCAPYSGMPTWYSDAI